MKGIQLYLPLWAVLTFWLARPLVAQQAMENVHLVEVLSPYGDRFSVALLEGREAKQLYQEVGGRNVTAEFDLPKLRNTYQLTNGWILYQQYVTGEWFIYTDRSIFEQINQLAFDPGMGIEFDQSRERAEFYFYNITKKIPLEKILNSGNWEEIPSLRNDAKFLRNERGFILELDLPGLNWGTWHESMEHYEKHAKRRRED